MGIQKSTMTVNYDLIQSPTYSITKRGCSVSHPGALVHDSPGDQVATGKERLGEHENLLL